MYYVPQLVKCSELFEPEPELQLVCCHIRTPTRNILNLIFTLIIYDLLCLYTVKDKDSWQTFLFTVHKWKTEDMNSGWYNHWSPLDGIVYVTVLMRVTQWQWPSSLKLYSPCTPHLSGHWHKHLISQIVDQTKQTLVFGFNQRWYKVN